MDIRVSFTGTKTVRQTVEATVTVDGDFIRQAMIDEYGNDLSHALSIGGADFDLEGTNVTVVFTVDIADQLSDMISNSQWDDVTVTDPDIDMDYSEEWDDIEDLEVI